MGNGRGIVGRARLLGILLLLLNLLHLRLLHLLRWLQLHLLLCQLVLLLRLLLQRLLMLMLVRRLRRRLLLRLLVLRLQLLMRERRFGVDWLHAVRKSVSSAVLAAVVPPISLVIPAVIVVAVLLVVLVGHVCSVRVGHVGLCVRGLRGCGGGSGSLVSSGDETRLTSGLQMTNLSAQVTAST